MKKKGVTKNYEILDHILLYGNKFHFLQTTFKAETQFSLQLQEDTKLSLKEPIDVITNKFSLISGGRFDPEISNDITFTPEMIVIPLPLKDKDTSSFRYWLQKQ